MRSSGLPLNSPSSIAGYLPSHHSIAVWFGSEARSLWVIVLPVLGSPTIIMGALISSVNISGFLIRASSILSKFSNTPVSLCFCASRPISFKSASWLIDSISISNPVKNKGLPKLSKPV